MAGEGGWQAQVLGETGRVGRRVGGYGSDGRNVHTAQKGVCICGVKIALRTVLDRTSWRKIGAVEENKHELEKTAKLLEKIGTVIWHMARSAPC